MELKLKPATSNYAPLLGILVSGKQPSEWLKAIHQLGFSLHAIKTFPIPDSVPNSVWGCLLVPLSMPTQLNIGKYTRCQFVDDVLFIPEKSVLYPKLGEDELKELLWGKLHVLHPEFGLLELEAAFDWKSIISAPKKSILKITKPVETKSQTTKIKSFQVYSVSPEEVLENLEKEDFPQRSKLEDKPLNLMEQARLAFYRKLFNKDKDDQEMSKTSLMSMLESARGMFDQNSGEWTDEMRQDYEELERRNKKQIDRLLDMLKDNPDEALKYAIPLDDDGTSRGGGGVGEFNLFKRWGDFSLFGTSGGFGSGGGSAPVSNDSYYSLQQQYNETAKRLIKEGDFKKAAFIYMKLLKNYYLAAQTLESGGFYQEAASVYLKYVKNKNKAAECYEKGNLIQDAIEVYKDMGQNEKVGDLYMQIFQEDKAMGYYEKVLDGYKEKYQYVKGALLCKNKMKRLAQAQELLIEGWRNNRDAYSCLNNYFNNIEDEKALEEALLKVYENEVNAQNQTVFLKAIKQEFEKHQMLQGTIRAMAHEIIVDQLQNNPDMALELRFFNKEDKMLQKDSMRFRLQNRKK